MNLLRVKLKGKEKRHGPEHRRGFVPAVEPLAHRSARASEGAEDDGEDGDDERYDHQIGKGARRHIRELSASSSPTPAPSSSPPASPYTRLNPNPKRREERKGLATPRPTIFNPLPHPRRSARRTTRDLASRVRIQLPTLPYGPKLILDPYVIEDYRLNGKGGKDGRNFLALRTYTWICQCCVVKHTVTCGPKVRLAPQSVYNVLVA
jgi:hypothetical protein